MTPSQIQSIRHALGESTATFAKRFACSPRTVENWEQGIRKPSPLIIRMLEQLEKELGKKKKKGRKPA